jgi:hypothetical protein
MKTFLGVLVIAFFGFCTFTSLVGIGLVVGVVLALFTWWQIILGTLLGSLMVILHLLYGSTKS